MFHNSLLFLGKELPSMVFYKSKSVKFLKEIENRVKE